MTDKNTLDLARQWAADIDADCQTLSQDTIDAAADLISSLPDEWVDAKELREVVADHHIDMSEELMEALGALLPTPPAPRTMAEIEWDEAEHHLAEARVAEVEFDGNISDTVIMLGVNRFGNISALDTSTWAAWALSKDTLTPTGRKYRLIPDEGVPEGDPIETEDDHVPPTPESASPRPEDVPVGEPWQVEVGGQVAIGYRNDPDDVFCWAVVYRDDSVQVWMYDSDVTLIARLVPETTKQDTKTVFDPAYTYSDRDGDEWEYLDGRWITGYTHDERVVSREAGFGLKTLPDRWGTYTRIEA